MSGTGRPSTRKSDSRRSSFFARARASFVRSKGHRGASVEELRGTNGADFEGTGRIHRRGGTGASCCGRKNDEFADRYIMIKGPFIFVFKEESAQSPKYAIGLQYMQPNIKEKASGRTTVLLQTNLGDVEYEANFDDVEVAKQFAAAVTTQSMVADAEAVRKRLGHEHLLHKRSSIQYAEKIAMIKLDEQPDTPVSATDVLQHMPTPAGY